MENKTTTGNNKPVVLSTTVPGPKILAPQLMYINPNEIDEPELFAMRDISKSDVTELAENIKSVGRLINPLVVRQGKNGRYELLCGRRRLKALRMLKINMAPAQVVNVTDTEAFVTAISEHVGRTDPTPLEEATAYQRARDKFKLDLDTIAKNAGKDKTTVSNRIRLLTMAPKVKQALTEGKITAGHCEHGFLRLKHQQDQEALLDDVNEQIEYNDPYTVKEIERQAKELAQKRDGTEQLANWMREHKDKIKTPLCPYCKGEPTFNYRTDLKKNLISCSRCYNTWNPLIEPKPQEKPKPGTPNYRPPRDEVQNQYYARDHLSQYTPTEFFKAISQYLVDKNLIDELEIDGSTSIRIETKEFTGFPLPTMTVNHPSNKKGIHKSEITVGDSFSNDNEDALEHRNILWQLESKLGKKDKAEIIREPMDRLILEHKTLLKGTELLVKTGSLQGKWVVQGVHKDFTAYVMNPKNVKVFLEEKGVRELIKAANPPKKKK